MKIYQVTTGVQGQVTVGYFYDKENAQKAFNSFNPSASCGGNLLQHEVIDGVELESKLEKAITAFKKIDDFNDNMATYDDRINDCIREILKVIGE